MKCDTCTHVAVWTYKLGRTRFACVRCRRDIEAMQFGEVIDQVAEKLKDIAATLPPDVAEQIRSLAEQIQ